ncbi:MAG: hypothetical protein ACJ741_19705, partial [Pyrinomonadaceae bacterium]
TTTVNAATMVNVTTSNFCIRFVLRTAGLELTFDGTSRLPKVELLAIVVVIALAYIGAGTTVPLPRAGGSTDATTTG